MSRYLIRTMECCCDGRYEGCDHGRRCRITGGGRWSPYFCADCDQRRVQHIAAGLQEIRDSFTKKGNTNATT